MEFYSYILLALDAGTAKAVATASTDGDGIAAWAASDVTIRENRPSQHLKLEIRDQQDLIGGRWKCRGLHFPP